MLIKGNDVLDLKVISINEGKYIENVDDLIYDPRTHKVRALLVDKGGWFSKAKVILFEDIKTIGKDAIIIESESQLKTADEVGERIATISKSDTFLTKTKIITETGTELGSVSDIYFDQKTGDVIDLEVSQGGLKDLQSGKKRVKVSDIITIGEDATIVKGYAEAVIAQQAQQQGLQGALNKGVSQAKQAYEGAKDLPNDPQMNTKVDTTKTQVSDFVEAANQKILEINERIKQKANDTQPKVQQKAGTVVSQVKQKAEETRETMEYKKKEDAAGKYLKVNILSPKDELIAKRGEMVTHSIIKKAENFGVLDKVLNNTTAEPIMA